MFIKYPFLSYCLLFYWWPRSGKLLREGISSPKGNQEPSTLMFTARPAPRILKMIQIIHLRWKETSLWGPLQTSFQCQAHPLLWSLWAQRKNTLGMTSTSNRGCRSELLPLAPIERVQLWLASAWIDAFPQF